LFYLLSSLNELEEKTQKLQSLIRQERQLSDNEAKKRDELNTAFKTLISEYRELKNKRDEAIQRAKELRDKKEAVYQELQKFHSELKGREAELSAVINIDRQVQRIKEALERAEWDYQTRSMSSTAAKNLEKEIEELEQKLAAIQKKQEGYKATFELKRQYDEKLKVFRELKEQFRKTISELDELRSKSAAKLGEAKRIKAEADQRHQKYIEHANEVIKLQAELNALRMQMQETRRDTRQRSQYEQRDKTNRLITEKVTKAKEKLNKGEKLNFEEWQALLLGEELAQR
jgi:uncharacterized coiled-coil DUF342 family protein